MRASRHGSRAVRADGFVLLEVLVAFTIFVLVLGAVMEVFSRGVNVVRAGDQYTRAVLLAQSKLAELDVEPLGTGVYQGRFDTTFGWRTSVTRYPWRQAEANDGSSIPMQPLLATVEISWSDGSARRSVSLTSLELAPRAP